LDGAPFVYLPDDLGAHEVLVRVWGARRQPYALALAAVDPGSRFEPNDDQVIATALRPGRTVALTGDGNDWYSVDVPARRPLRVALVDAAPSLVLRSTLKPGDGPLTGPGARTLALQARELPARVWVEVTGAGPYELEVELGPLERPAASA